MNKHWAAVFFIDYH